VLFGPPFGFIVEGVDVADALNGFPAEEGVVSDEGGGVAGSDTVFDGGVDDVGEIGDWLELRMGKLIRLGIRDLLPFSNVLWTTCMTPEPCCRIATSGDSCNSSAP